LTSIGEPKRSIALTALTRRVRLPLPPPRRIDSRICGSCHAAAGQRVSEPRYDAPAAPTGPARQRVRSRRGADTWAVEVLPGEKGAGAFEVHQILLATNGIHILENMNTEDMVKDKAWESFFTLGPSRITGAVQAIINPIAIK
jgi:hypothetical protein